MNLFMQEQNKYARKLGSPQKARKKKLRKQIKNLRKQAKMIK